MKKPPKKLYKYYSTAILNLIALKNQQIFFSSQSRFNDPFDSPKHIINPQFKEADFQRAWREYCLEQNARGENKNVSDKSISEVPSWFKEQHKTSVLEFFKEKNAFNTTGIFCLSEKNDDILMWSHYAENHKGFVLEFDTSFEPFNKSFPIEYLDDISPISSTKLFYGDSTRFVQNMLCKKYRNWAYEYEWRCFHREKDKLFTYEPEALTGIYLGWKIDRALMEIIFSFMMNQNSNVKYYLAANVPNQFKIEFKEIKYTPYLEAKSKGLIK